MSPGSDFSAGGTFTTSTGAICLFSASAMRALEEALVIVRNFLDEPFGFVDFTFPEQAIDAAYMILAAQYVVVLVEQFGFRVLVIIIIHPRFPDQGLESLRAFGGFKFGHVRDGRVLAEPVGKRLIRRVAGEQRHFRVTLQRCLVRPVRVFSHEGGDGVEIGIRAGVPSGIPT